MPSPSASPAPRLPPGPALPEAVQRLAWAQRPIGFALGCRRRYGDVFTLRFGRGLTLVVVSDPAVVGALFAAGPEAVRRGDAPTRRRILGEASVVVLDGAEHARQRRFLHPPLHGDAVAAQATTVAELAARTVDRWPADAPVPLLPSLGALAREALLRVVCGLGDDDPSGLAACLHAFERAGARRRPSVPLVRRRWGPGVPSRRLRAALAGVDGALARTIADRRAEGRDGRTDVLSLLVDARDEDGRGLTDRELRDELLTLLVSGRDPLVSALAWTFERLVRHPDVLERVRREPAGGPGPYADAAVREVLRVRPPAWLTNARTARGPLRVGDHVVPPGTMVTACTALLHHRDDVFPEPTRLRPERFLDAPADPSWIPFGGGRRRCVGDRLALLTCATVLRTAVERRELRPAEPGDERQREVGTVFLPAAGARVVAGRR